MRLMLNVLFLLVLGGFCAGQTAPTDSQTLQAILAELRQLRQDLKANSAMAARAQVALYRLQRQDEAVARARQRVDNVRSKVAKLETDKNNKALEIEQGKAATSRSPNPEAEQNFTGVVLPALRSQLELLQKQEAQARTEESEAEQQLRDEQTRLDGLNDLLDRYNTALEETGRK